jgi:hypothetical protein
MTATSTPPTTTSTPSSAVVPPPPTSGTTPPVGRLIVRIALYFFAAIQIGIAVYWFSRLMTTEAILALISSVVTLLTLAASETDQVYNRISIWFNARSVVYFMIGVIIALLFAYRSEIAIALWGQSQLSLETVSSKVRGFRGVEEGKVVQPDQLPQYDLAFLSGENDSYFFYYVLQEKTSSYAGFAFELDRPQDFKDYKNIQVRMNMDDPNARTTLKITDVDKKSVYIRLDGNIVDKNISTAVVGIHRTVDIDMAYFEGEDIELSSIISVEFVVSDYFTTGKHYFTVEDVILTQ